MADTKAKANIQKSVYVIAGEDPAMLSIECEKLLAQFIDHSDRQLGLFNVDTKLAQPAEVFDELRTLPFLTAKRVVLIKDAEDFISDNRQLFEGYFDNPSPTGILIIMVKTWDSRTRLAKKLPEIGELITVTQPKPWQLSEYLVRYAADRHKKTLTRPAAQLLIELAGDNLPQLYGEIDKLVLYIDTEKIITPKHVESLIGHNRVFNCFNVIDAIVAGNAAQAVTRLRNMFAEDRSAEYTFVGAFAYHFRRMFNAKTMLERGLTPAAVAPKIQLWYNKDAFFAQLEKLTLAQIGSIIQLLAQLDYEIKTGQARPQIAAEQLVLKLASSRNS